MKLAGMLVLLVACLQTTGARGEGILLDSRFDLNSVSYNDDAKSAGSKENTSFQGARLRLLFSGKIKEDLTAKLRLNPLVNNSAPSTEAKFSKFIDYGFLTHQVNPSFYVSAGKVIALVGGREGTVNPGDYYFVSKAGEEILAADTASVHALPILWPVGAILGTNFGDHKVEVLFANTSVEDASGTTPTQTRLMAGVSWSGAFAEKTILPLFSYHRDTETENTEKRDYISLGSRFILDAFEIDLDYLNNSKSYKTWAANGSKDLTSIVGSLRYKANDSLQLVAKIDAATDKLAKTAATSPEFTTVNYTQLGLAAEYYPIAETKFRYHAAVVKKDTKPESGNTLSETKVMLGVRLVADILK